MRCIERPDALSRSRGFTLIEIMVGLTLASLAMVFLLNVMRTQLSSYELTDQIAQAQHSLRTGATFLESELRRTCGGIANGRVAVNLAGAPQRIEWCVRPYAGPVVSVGTPRFVDGDGRSLPDAVELLYGTAPFTQATSALTGFPPSVQVQSATGLSVGDVVLVGNLNEGVILRIASITGGAATTLTFEPPGGALLWPGGYTTPAAGDAILSVRSEAIFVSPSGPFAGMLMLDPDGLLGTDHGDAQPLLEAVEDFQLAVGFDANGDGLSTESGPDEWLGNTVGAVEFPLDAANPWNRRGTLPLPLPQYRQLRASLRIKTRTSYPGQSTPLSPLEDRTVYPSLTTPVPRYRTTRMTITPRSWSMGN
jgi:prepilin-type N-terminal cleavage/methylation domain-containing protein